MVLTRKNYMLRDKLIQSLNFTVSCHIYSYSCLVTGKDFHRTFRGSHIQGKLRVQNDSVHRCRHPTNS